MNYQLFTNLSPVIQVFIGFYSLLFFEQVLKCSPLKQKEKEIEKDLHDFMSRFQQFFSATDDRDGGHLERLNEFLEKEEKRWGLFYKTLQDIGTFLFLYSLFLLVYAGLEEHFSESVFFSDYFYGIGVFVALYVVLYVLIVFSFYQKIRSFWIYRAILFFVLLLFFLFGFYYIQTLSDFFIGISFVIDKGFIIFSCLIACSSGFIGLCLRLLYLHFHFKSFKKKIEITSEYANCIMDVTHGVNSERFKQKKEKKILKKIFDSNIDYLVANSISVEPKKFFQEEFFQKEIEKALDSLIREKSVWEEIRDFIKN